MAQLVQSIEAELAGTTDDIAFVTAIVYPELLRYSQRRDQLEIALNKLLFSLSDEIDGCSIGAMQMKPRFAILVEQRIAEKAEWVQRYAAINFNGKNDSLNSRLARVERLQSLALQCLYLRAFIDTCTETLQLAEKDTIYRLQILAAAYNAGMNRPLVQLEQLRSLPHVVCAVEYYQRTD